MSRSITVTLPEKVAEYLRRKSREAYLPLSAVARQYIASVVVEEMVLEYHRKGFSISRISQLTDTPAARVMEILSKLGEELEDLDAELGEIEEI